MRKPSARHLALALLFAASVAFLLHSLRSAAPLPSSEGGDSQTAPISSEPTRRLQPAVSAEVDFGRYAALANTNVFSERRSEPPPKKPEKPKPPPPLPGSEQSKAREPKPDVAGWSYVGYIKVDGKPLGILQNDTTHTSKCLAVGDSFQGATVEKIDREAMVLGSGSSRTTLSRPRDFPVTPLDKTAGRERAPRRGQR